MKGTTVTNLEVFIVFCARNNRRIFEIAGTEAAFLKSVEVINENTTIRIKDAVCTQESVSLTVSVPADTSVQNTISTIKKISAAHLREEVPQLAGVTQIWTKHYFAATHKPTAPTVQAFVEAQVKTFD